ncbi:MAG: ribbon-helix-helix domain-containing protein [Prosthecobacter sp.]|uniref:ribbon-helix-helix protein, CopG family n=1 Tax=Prosthecobacter sp. TaxID=1965333 RepID=UPI002629BD5B|nr:ribbon-helix-helix protein, CopG family [Prosthecobacter sp.]MCF7789677.1 ribbon-helix-helix domain-containing protein [Prosthecobacter sp.]
MTRTQIQFPDPLYQRLKEIAERQDWSLSEVMRKAAEHFITRFPEDPKPQNVWRFPTLDCGGDFLTDPKQTHPEADAIRARTAA